MAWTALGLATFVYPSALYLGKRMGSFRSRKRKQTKPEPDKPYVPNKVHGKRLMAGLILFWAVFGGYQLYVFDRAPLPIQGDRRIGREMAYLEGDLAYVLYAGLILLSISMLVRIIDHYDKRDNEKLYKAIAKNTLWAGVAVCLTSCLLK